MVILFSFTAGVDPEKRKKMCFDNGHNYKINTNVFFGCFFFFLKPHAQIIKN